MASESKAAADEGVPMEPDVGVKLSVSGSTNSGGVFPTNLRKALQDAMLMALNRKWAPSGRSETHPVLAQTADGDREVDMDSCVLVRAVIENMMVYDAAADGVPARYAIDLETACPSEETGCVHTFPDGTYDTLGRSPELHTAILLSDGGSVAKLGAPVDLLSNAEYLGSGAYHESIGNSPLRHIPSTNPEEAVEAMCLKYTMQGASSYDASETFVWTFLRCSDEDATRVWKDFRETVFDLWGSRYLKHGVASAALASLTQPDQEELPLTELVPEGAKVAGDALFAYIGKVGPGWSISMTRDVYEAVAAAAGAAATAARPYHISDDISVAIKKAPVGGSEWVAATGVAVAFDLSVIAIPQTTRLIPE